MSQLVLGNVEKINKVIKTLALRRKGEAIRKNMVNVKTHKRDMMKITERRVV